MRLTTQALALVAAAALAASPVTAQAPIELKLATFAPENTKWHRALLDFGAAAAKDTAGRVKTTIYANGQQGAEPTVLTKMRAGLLNSALLMPAGLTQIDPSAGVFGLPFFLQSDEELVHLLDKVGPEVARRLEAKGFHVLNWGSAGWAQIFSKQEIRTLAELKAATLYTSAGDDAMVRWYTENGFKVQPLSETAIKAQLTLPAGMINAAPSPPYGALALQFYVAAPYVLDLKIAPLVGATLITTAAWNRLTPEDRAVMSAAAQAMEKWLMAEVARTDRDSMAAMVKAKLKVTVPTAAAKAEFEQAAARLVPTLRGRIVPADIYDMALKERDAFRQSKGR